MTNEEAIKDLERLKQLELFIPALDIAIKALEPKTEIDTEIYDEEEIHYNCMVQIWKNSVTGKVSIGWTEGISE